MRTIYRAAAPFVPAIGNRAGDRYVKPAMTIEMPSTTDLEALALARRSGWPEDLRVLVARFPREQWQGHANLGEMARFWLSRHAMFRELAATIQAVETQFREGALSPAEFPRHLVPRLQFLLSQLNVHHQIEDLHYFPIFRAAEARLARGFDVLEGDHHAIHADMENTANTANALLARACWRAASAAPLRRRLRGRQRRPAQRADPPSRRRRRPDRSADSRPRRGSARRRASRLIYTRLEFGRG